MHTQICITNIWRESGDYMRRAVCFLLVISLVLSLAIPSFANEIEEPQYGTINVEYTDSIGSIEHLDVMMQDSHVYADANILSERLGYKCMQEGDVVSIYANNDLFSHNVPLLAVHFRANSTDVSYNPMFGAECQYTAPVPCIINDKGIWVPLAYTLVLLGGNSTALTDTLLIQMPQENVLSVAALIANNEQYLSFDWVDDFGYSETTTDVTNGAARIVTLFSGLLEFDGAAWLSLVDWSAFDRKFGDLLVTMFCTYSEEELDENILQVEALLDVLSEDGKFGSLLHNKQARLDSDVTAWQTACEEYLNLLEDGSGSPAKYNLLYQQYERAMDKQTLFATLGGEGMTHIQDELSSATNVLDIASILSTTVSYLSEFQQKDEYMFSVLKNYLRQRTKTDNLPDGTAQAMQNYLNVMDLGALGYGAYRYIEENWLKCIVDESGLDMVLGAPANVLLFAWDIMSGTIPFYSDGLDAVKNREISNYAQKLQKDALVNLNNMLGELKYSSTISKDDCIRLSEYCYVYLKACYIARATAIKALDNTSEEFQRQIEGKLNAETDINKIIAHYLAILSSADAENRGYVLGFLPENNAEYLKHYSDKEVTVEITFDGEASGQARMLKKINRYDENGILKQVTIFNYSANGTLINAVDRELEQTGSVVHEAVIPFTFDEKGRLTEIGTADSDYYYYETAGYVYNNSDQLISSFLASGGGSDITYEYDDQNRLVRQFEDDHSAPITVEAFFYYDDDTKSEIRAKEITTSSWDGESPTVEEKAYVYSLDGNGRVVTICGESDITTYRYEYWPIVIEEHVNSDTGYIYQELNYVDRMGETIWSIYLASAISEEQTLDDGSLNKVILDTNSRTVTYEFIYHESDTASTSQSGGNNAFGTVESVQYEHQLVDQSYYDQTGLLKIQYSYDQIEILDQTQVAKEINTSISQDAHNFLNQLSLEDQQEYAATPWMGDGYFWYTAESEVTNNSNSILSICVSTSWCMGGVHNLNYYGLNFDLNTGRYVDLSILLGIDENELTSKLKDIAWEYLSQNHKDAMFDDAYETLYNYTYDNFIYYFKDNELILTFPTYALGYGASGSFTVPTGLFI